MEFRTEKLELMRLEAAERAQQEEIEGQKKHEKEMKELKRRESDRKKVFSLFLFEFSFCFRCSSQEMNESGHGLCANNPRTEPRNLKKVVILVFDLCVLLVMQDRHRYIRILSNPFLS